MAEIIVRLGNVPKEITREAERLPADLLILGTHGRSGFERLFLGSVTEKVLRSTRVPVLTIPPPVQHPGSPVYKTILCPVDFSDASIRALEYALSLAQQADARLILLHVIENVLGDIGAEQLGHLPLSEYTTPRAGCGNRAESGHTRGCPCLVHADRTSRERACVPSKF